MENPRRRQHATGQISTRQRWPHPGAANPHSHQRKTGLLNRSNLSSVHAVIPRNAERARLYAHNHRVSGAKSIVVIEIHGQALDLLSLAPGMHEQSARAAHDTWHVVAAIHNGWVKCHVLL